MRKQNIFIYNKELDKSIIKDKNSKIRRIIYDNAIDEFAERIKKIIRDAWYERTGPGDFRRASLRPPAVLPDEAIVAMESWVKGGVSKETKQTKQHGKNNS